MLHPAYFPDLPATPANFQWSADVLQAHNVIATAYDRAATLLRLEESDPLRLQVHCDQLLNRILPIMDALATEVGDQTWIEECADALGALLVTLQRAIVIATGVENSKLQRVVPIKIQRDGRGRPRKVLEPVWLADAVSEHRKITLQALADGLGIHRNTLRNYLKQYRVYRRYSDLSDHDLDILVRRFKKVKPSSGLRYLIGFLRTHGLRIQRERVRKSLRRIDGLGQVLRRNTIKRREYYSPRPNSVWHMDGHHKLIRWGIVIHGFIDGYDRTVVGLRAHTNNKAETVLDLFLKAVAEYGAPSRARGDRGGENIEVSVWMIKYRGPNRGSFLWGTSTRNTRIERLWVEVGSQFARQWRAFFLRLERLHRLDPDNPHHLWLLHYLFLDEVNGDCTEFKAHWNHHPISGKGRNQSPLDLRLHGELLYGKYADDFEDVHPDILQRYGQRDDLDAAIAEDQDHQVRHDAVDVVQTQHPFLTDAAHQAFRATVLDVQHEGIIPDQLGVAEAEWEDGVYGETETIRVGRKEAEVILPFSVWWPRAVMWAQGLEILVKIQAVESGEIPML